MVCWTQSPVWIMSQRIVTACLEGNLDVVTSLLEEGGDPNTSQAGQSLLHLAIQSGHTELVRLLLSHPDTDVNMTDTAGLTPLHLASSQGRDKIVRIMVGSEAKVDVNKKCHQGFNPLLTAAMEGG